MTTQKEGTEKITITRDTGFLGAGRYVHVMVDGKPVATLNPEEKAEIYLPLKTWFHLAACMGWSSDNLCADRMFEIKQLVHGRNQKYRISFLELGPLVIRSTGF